MKAFSAHNKSFAPLVAKGQEQHGLGSSAGCGGAGAKAAGAAVLRSGRMVLEVLYLRLQTSPPLKRCQNVYMEKRSVSSTWVWPSFCWFASRRDAFLPPSSHAVCPQLLNIH